MSTSLCLFQFIAAQTEAAEIKVNLRLSNCIPFQIINIGALVENILKAPHHTTCWEWD